MNMPINAHTVLDKLNMHIKKPEVKARDKNKNAINFTFIFLFEYNVCLEKCFERSNPFRGTHCRSTSPIYKG